MMLRRFLTALVLLAPSFAFGQGSVLQGGPQAPGRAPMYIGTGSQAVIGDSGSAAGGGAGVGLSELNITSRPGNGDNTAPYASNGNGQLSAHFCLYDAPITNSTGYHWLCMDPNSQGGALIASGAGGAATALPLSFNVNGVAYAFPFVIGGIVGPGTTTVGDLVVWNNTSGTLVSDLAILGATHGGTGVASPTGYLYGNGASPITASTTIPSSVTTFTAPGTGAGATTANNIFNYVVYAQYYNTVGHPVDPTGVLDSTAGIQAAITAAGVIAASSQGGAEVMLPCGNYKVSATLVMSVNATSFVGAAKSCVFINRYTNYGATFKLANASALLSHVQLREVTFQDISAVTGAAGFSSCATSPFHIVADGINDLTITNVTTAYGCGGLAIQGVINAKITSLDSETFAIPGQAGENGLGSLLYVGSTTNGATGITYSANIFISQLEIECGTITGTLKAAYGVNVGGVDGLWINNAHIQGGVLADMLVGNTNGVILANIFVSNTLWDVTPGGGILFNGTTQVVRAKFEGYASAAAQFPTSAANYGVLVTSTGGLSQVDFELGINGFAKTGFYSSATNVTDVQLKLRAVTNNNLIASTDTAGDAAAVAVYKGSRITISGGTAGGDGKVVNGIYIGSLVSDFTIVGVNMTDTTGYGLKIVNGATVGSVSGNVFNQAASGSTGAVSDAATVGTISYSGNAGLPWFAYSPSITCTATVPGAGLTSTGRYIVEGKTISISINILEGTNAPCVTSFNASLPVAPRVNTMLGGATNVTAPKSLKVIATTGAIASIAFYDNAFPGANNEQFYIQGQYEIN